MIEIKRRKLFQKIIRYIDDNEVIVIHGSRQVGKTSLLYYIIEHCLKKISSEQNIFYFDLEDFQLLDLCNTSPGEVILYLKSKGVNTDKKVYLLIDEIQYMNNPSSFLKLFHDRYKGKVKLIVSGSSSMLIKKKFSDSLAGRVVDFELFTLDFEEFLNFKGFSYRLELKLTDTINKELSKLYVEFIIFGGYPAIVLEDNIEKKEIKLKQIINAYIKKDIRDIADIRDINKFNELVKILASQSSGLLNILELSNTAGLAKQTLSEYIFLLENTYIIKRVRPFHRNIRSELIKMPKIYFEDTGLANILTNKTFSQNITGNLLENSIYSELRKNLSAENIYFWRTNKKQEIDFIIEDIKKKILNAIEVKNIYYSKHNRKLLYFKKEYNNTSMYCCCLRKNEKSKDKNIIVIYPWELRYRRLF